MCEVMRALGRMERELMDRHGLTLNEAMVMCCIAGDTPTATGICEGTGLVPSHASKVIRSVEAKGYVRRAPGTTDRRQMLFSLTPAGETVLADLRKHPMDLPAALQPLLPRE